VSARKRIAAIDVGSNSTHLVIAEADDLGHIHILETLKEQTLLGASINDDGCLDADAVIRLSRVLKRMSELCRNYGAEVRAVGTQSLRAAKNGTEFCRKVAKRCGVQIEIVTGKEEARLIYLGIQLGLEIRSRDVLVMDIGGGSTEILVGERGEEQYSTSLKLGCVRLSQGMFESQTYSPAEIKRLEKEVSLRFKSIASDVKKVGYDVTVCSSGTVKAVKQLALGLARKDVPENLHGASLSIAEIEQAYAALTQALTAKERRSLPQVEEQRADLLLAGCAILREFSLQHGITEWTLSGFALREGILVDLVSRGGEWLKGDPEDVRWRSVRSFAKRLQIDELHAHRIATLALKIFDGLVGLEAHPEIWREYLRCASFLHEAGRFLSFSGYHKHSYYLIRNASLLGFTLTEQESIALIARFHRKRAPKLQDDFFSDIAEEDRRRVQFCGAVLRMAVACDKSRSGIVSDISTTISSGTIGFGLKCRSSEQPLSEIFHFEGEKSCLETVFRRSVSISIIKS
jgi:exopolyphosphatase/guanosine-5'-triphosphate,3'-diphosphate pyrophosphatase